MRRGEEGKFLRDPIGRLLAADGPNVEINPVSEIWDGGVRQDAGYHAQRNIRHIVVRSPAVRPACFIRCRIAAGVMGKRA